MKRYKKFMDGVRASDTLHQRLTELEAPERRSAPWAGYGAMAAAFALMAVVTSLMCIPSWGMAGNPGVHPGPVSEHLAESGAPDITPEDPEGSTEPAATRFAGRYEVTQDGVTTSYLLPYIEYGAADGQATAADWDLPSGAVRRELTWEDIAALLGGEDAVDTHLAWGVMYSMTGWAAWNGDGSFWGAYLDGIVPNYGAELNSFEFAVTAGQLPPTCYGYPESVEQNISGVMVTADKADWESRFGEETASVHDRRVSFMTDDYGYRFEVRSGDADRAEELVSRLVRWVIENGVAADQLSSEGAVLAHPWEADPDSGVGGPNWSDSVPDQDISGYDPSGSSTATETCPDCGVSYPAGEAHYHTQTCPDCGENYAAGTAHDCAMCDGYPEPHTCERCGAVYPEGTEHECELCGLPLASSTQTCPKCGESYRADHHHTCAPDPVNTFEGAAGTVNSHICEVCGQTLEPGVEHSHQSGHRGDRQ